MTRGDFVISEAARRPAPTAPLDRRARDWLLEMQRCVRARDFAGGRALFADDVFSFGTRTPVAEDAAELEREQWREVWTQTAGFTFELERARSIFEGRLRCIAVPWRSLGLRGGSTFERRGRATLVLAGGEDRRYPEGGLICVHSHFSIEPDADRP
jgi:hypothetical protein